MPGLVSGGSVHRPDGGTLVPAGVVSGAARRPGVRHHQGRAGADADPQGAARHQGTERGTAAAHPAQALERRGTAGRYGPPRSVSQARQGHPDPEQLRPECDERCHRLCGRCPRERHPGHRLRRHAGGDGKGFARPSGPAARLCAHHPQNPGFRVPLRRGGGPQGAFLHAPPQSALHRGDPRPAHRHCPG